MSNAKPVTDQDWETEVAQSPTPVLVDFWAEWCGPCRMVSPIVEEIADEKPDELKVVKVNVDESPQIARNYKVMSIPTLMIFSGGDEQKRLVGAKGKNEILSELADVL